MAAPYHQAPTRGGSYANSARSQPHQDDRYPRGGRDDFAGNNQPAYDSPQNTRPPPTRQPQDNRSSGYSNDVRSQNYNNGPPRSGPNQSRPPPSGYDDDRGNGHGNYDRQARHSDQRTDVRDFGNQQPRSNDSGNYQNRNAPRGDDFYEGNNRPSRDDGGRGHPPPRDNYADRSRLSDDARGPPSQRNYPADNRGPQRSYDNREASQQNDYSQDDRGYNYPSNDNRGPPRNYADNRAPPQSNYSSNDSREERYTRNDDRGNQRNFPPSDRREPSQRSFNPQENRGPPQQNYSSRSYANNGPDEGNFGYDDSRVPRNNAPQAGFGRGGSRNVGGNSDNGYGGSNGRQEGGGSYAPSNRGRSYGGPNSGQRSYDSGNDNSRRYDGSNQQSYQQPDHYDRAPDQSQQRPPFTTTSSREGGNYSNRGGGGFNSYNTGGRGPPNTYESNGYDSGRGGTTYSSRGGGNSFNNERFNAGRYNDRRDTNGVAGYSGVQSGGSGDRNPENHAPRGYKPVERTLEEIFAEDLEDVKKNTATIFDADADVVVEEVADQIINETWGEMDLHEKLLKNIKDSGFIKPRKIQQYTIPYILEDYDVKCQGETGSGKTLAFLAPIIHKLLIDKDEGVEFSHLHPQCLIIAPTRELAGQIYEQAKKFCKDTGISVVRAYGEYGVRENINAIQAGCNIICACIGRLMHFVKNGEIHLSQVKYLVIDEADRLFMENNNSDVLQLFQWGELKKISEGRQTLLFSATLKNTNVDDITRNYMRQDKCAKITAKSQSNKRVQYKVFAVPNAAAKFKYLVKYLKKIKEENGDTCPRTLIFVNRKVNTDRIAMTCIENGFPATTIHGDRGQHLREEALANFRSGKTRCLVATDVCARGVDIKEMDHVINFDLPSEKDAYVQRCGRTGRTHNGTAMSLYLEEDDSQLANYIGDVIGKNGQEAPQFLFGRVYPSDYNFGEPEAEEEPMSNGVAHTDNYEHQSPSESVENASVNQAAPQIIADNTGDDDWD